MMKETAEFRIQEEYAKEFLPDEMGKSLMGLVRKVIVSVESDEYQRIGELTQFVRKRDNKFFFHGWSISRSYSKMELNCAELLLVKPTKTFEPAGEECGTQYDFTKKCQICGSGYRQVSELILDLRKVPRNTDIARTISDEIIISQKFATILTENQLSGFVLKPVHHKRCLDDTSNQLGSKWLQFFSNSTVKLSPTTITGNAPFDYDDTNEYRCKNGHTAGLNILSEPFIYRDSWDGRDVVATKEEVGINLNLLRTHPLILISQKTFRLLEKEQCKGFNVEVVHLV